MLFPTGDWGAQFRWSFTDAACQDALAKQRSAMAALKVVYDNDGLWDWGDPKGDGPELLHKMVDQYTDAGARALVWGCGNNTAWSYTPRAQEAWCDRVPADNPNIKTIADRQRAWLDAGTDELSRHQKGHFPAGILRPCVSRDRSQNVDCREVGGSPDDERLVGTGRSAWEALRYNSLGEHGTRQRNTGFRHD